ncbi:MAG: hypothetical protein LLG04_17955 [Parachlamydia sp.]|nr:hypothetical protein [Parachlamydia sp.]
MFHFPMVRGLEDVSERLNAVEADTLFAALMHAFSLRPIQNEEDARDAERVLEYIERAFEQDPPEDIERYRQVLLMLVTAFDEQHYVRAAGNMEPHEFLKALLQEDGVSQKALVPDCFKSESQVSEFLHQRKGRKNLFYEQAVVLGRRFGVDPLNFLRAHEIC